MFFLFRKITLTSNPEESNWLREVMCMCSGQDMTSSSSVLLQIRSASSIQNATMLAISMQVQSVDTLKALKMGQKVYHLITKLCCQDELYFVTTTDLQPGTELVRGFRERHFFSNPWTSRLISLKKIQQWSSGRVGPRLGVTSWDVVGAPWHLRVWRTTESTSRYGTTLPSVETLRYVLHTNFMTRLEILWAESGNSS